MKTIMSVFFLGGILFNMYGQSKSQIKDLGIKSTTVYEYDYSSGKGEKRLESVEKFNSHGDVVESIDYDKSGKQKEKVVYQYNNNYDVTEEKHFDSNNKPDKTYKYSYDGRLRTTKEKYDNNNRLVWKKEYVYER